MDCAHQYGAYGGHSPPYVHSFARAKNKCQQLWLNYSALFEELDVLDYGAFGLIVVLPGSGHPLMRFAVAPSLGSLLTTSYT